jgi:hypothetical protein
MSDAKTPRAGSGCFAKLLFISFFLLAIGFGSIVFFMFQPQDLTDIGGYGPKAQKIPERDLKVVLQNAIDRNFAVTLSEADINNWLARSLVLKQGGLLGDSTTLKRIWVRLEEGRAEVIMERLVLGMPLTVSMYLQFERTENTSGTSTEVALHGGPYHPDLPRPPRGGRFGKLVIPQGFLLLVMPSYEKLAALFPEEIHQILSEMARMKVQKGSLLLDPREPLGSQEVPLTF